MSKTNTGGPAFAQQLESNRDGYAVTGGMTLRDYFAAKALPICYQNYMHDYFHEDHDNYIVKDRSKRGDFLKDDKYAIAEIAYEMADAMLKARNEE